jgi:hypothetical protein
VCLAGNSIVSGGWKNIILLAEVARRQLQDSNVGAHTITGGSTNKIQCPGPGSTLTIKGGSYNSITNRCEYSTIVGGTGKYNFFISFVVVVDVVVIVFHQ